MKNVKLTCQVPDDHLLVSLDPRGLLQYNKKKKPTVDILFTSSKGRVFKITSSENVVLEISQDVKN